MNWEDENQHTQTNWEAEESVWLYMKQKHTVIIYYFHITISIRRTDSEKQLNERKKNIIIIIIIGGLEQRERKCFFEKSLMIFANVFSCVERNNE